MATLLSNLSVTVTHRTRACVLDPSLLLVSSGLEIVKLLGATLELWVAREFWHILNNSHFYQQHPQSIFFETVPKQTEVIQALQNLASFKANPGLSQLKLFWIGDTPGESSFPLNSESDLLQRWELLAHALDIYIEQEANCNAVIPVWRDTLSLAAALNSAFILTLQPLTEGTKHSPSICRAMESWGIPCREIAPLDAIATLERDSFQQLFVQAGLSKFLWAGLHLAILHLVVPASTFSGDRLSLNPHLSTARNNIDNTTLVSSVWNNSQGFWYGI